jgi:hypothetical protein
MPLSIPERWLHFLYRRLWLTFLLMGVFFLLFGVTSVNLFVLLKANIELFIEYGTMVIADGALEQLIDLILSAYLSITFFVLFKVCERVIVERLTEKKFGAARYRQKTAAPDSPPDAAAAKKARPAKGEI